MFKLFAVKVLQRLNLALCRFYDGATFVFLPHSWRTEESLRAGVCPLDTVDTIPTGPFFTVVFTFSKVCL